MSRSVGVADDQGTIRCRPMRRPDGANPDGGPAEKAGVAPASTQDPWHRAALAGAGAGILLRLWQYLGNPSLYLDELRLVDNILGRDLSGLLGRPLDHFQVAPGGFLAIEKLTTLLAGPSEYALRVFPLLAGLGTIVLTVLVARKLLTGPALALGVWLVALHPSLIHYSALVKQYSVDVVATLAILLLGVVLNEKGTSRRLWVGAATTGCASVWISHGAILTVAGVGFVLWVSCFGRSKRRERSTFLRISGLNALWLVAALGSLAWSYRTLEASTAAGMGSFWQDSFVPRDWWLHADTALWLWQRLAEFFSQAHYVLPGVYVALSAVGLAVLARRNLTNAALLAAPFLAALLAAGLERYPFRGRLVLFLVPLFLLTTAVGVQWVVSRLGLRGTGRTVGMGVLVIPAAAAIVFHPPVYDLQPIKPVLAHVAANRAPGDRIFAFHAADIALEYYGGRYGIDRDDYRLCSAPPTDARRHAAEIEELAPGRVWVVFTHVQPKFGERRAMLEALERRGERLDEISYGQESARAIVREILRDAGLAGEAAGRPSDVTGYDPLSDPWAAHAYLYELAAAGRGEHGAASDR